MAQTAQELGYDPNQIQNIGNGTSINSANLTPVPSSNFQSPQQTPVYPVSAIQVPQMQLTQPEQQASGVTQDLQALNQQLTGQSDYRTQQETSLGIPTLQKTRQDLTNRVQALQAEAQAIPLQLQQNATGRGITDAGLAPIQTAALRNNAIQALSASSLLNATNGNLTTAMAQADRAVSQRFDPIKEQIAAKQANLDLILKSPEYSVADKNRAAQQKAVQDEYARQIAKQEDNNKIALAMASAAVKNNPNDQSALMASQQVFNIDPKDPNYLSKVYSIVGKFQADPAQLQKDLDAHLLSQAQIGKYKADAAKAISDNKILSVAEAKSLGVPYGTTQAQAVTMNKTPGVSSQVGELKSNALQTAQSLLERLNSGQGSNAVGFLSLYPDIPGTPRANTVALIDHLKSLLSLDNVKYLKGQGQVSDAERKLLDQASGIANGLSRSQSKDSFKNSLAELIKSLSTETGAMQPGTQEGSTYDYNGVTYKIVNGEWVAQ